MPNKVTRSRGRWTGRALAGGRPEPEETQSEPSAGHELTCFAHHLNISLYPPNNNVYLFYLLMHSALGAGHELTCFVDHNFKSPLSPQ